jgi:hypothetical protein
MLTGRIDLTDGKHRAPLQRETLASERCYLDCDCFKKERADKDVSRNRNLVYVRASDYIDEY